MTGSETQKAGAVTRSLLPPWLLYPSRVVRTLPWEAKHLVRFVLDGRGQGDELRWRLSFLARSYRVSLTVNAQHNQVEILRIARAAMRIPASTRACLVEAGSFKGASTAKLSLLAERLGRQLVVFDSFEGIPENAETLQLNQYGTPREFARGMYAGALEEVKANVTRFGAPGVCRFVKGWFDDTMPSFREPVAVVFMDVDLVSSTKTCLENLWPLLVEGGSIFSHDGSLPAIRALLTDEAFWRSELSSSVPEMRGLGKTRLVEIVKRSSGS